MATPIVDGGPVATWPELEFTDLQARPKLSPAEILGNVYSWIESDLATEPFDRSTTVQKFEAEMIRRETLQQIKGHFDRLGAIDWV